MPGLFHVLTDIRNTPEYSIYHTDCKDFFDYLQDVPFKTIKTLSSFSDGHVTENEFEVIYRWSETYRKSIIAKFYKLDEWFMKNEDPMGVSFITLTVSGRNRTIEEAFEILKDSRNKFMKALRRALKHKFNYVWVMEPHPNGDVNHGYPHIHMILFDTIDIDQQINLRKLWEKYGAGSFEHGLDFDVREKQEKIESLRNYLIKYLSKSWISTGSKYDMVQWDKELYLFNMLAWKHTYRFWGCSRNLSKVMAYVPNEIYKLIPRTCISTELKDKFFDEMIGNTWKADEALVNQCKENFQNYYKRLCKMTYAA